MAGCVRVCEGPFRGCVGRRPLKELLQKSPYINYAIQVGLFTRPSVAAGFEPSHRCPSVCGVPRLVHPSHRFRSSKHMYTTSFSKVAHLPVSRNPRGYMQPSTWESKPRLTPPPSNFSDQRVGQASHMIKRPVTAVAAQYTRRMPSYPLTLQGVAPADRVPIAERGTTPNSSVRAFVSSRSAGSLLYQAPYIAKSERAA